MSLDTLRRYHRLSNKAYDYIEPVLNSGLKYFTNSSKRSHFHRLIASAGALSVAHSVSKLKRNYPTHPLLTTIPTRNVRFIKRFTKNRRMYQRKTWQSRARPTITRRAVTTMRRPITAMRRPIIRRPTFAMRYRRY